MNFVFQNHGILQSSFKNSNLHFRSSLLSCITSVRRGKTIRKKINIFVAFKIMRATKMIRIIWAAQHCQRIPNTQQKSFEIKIDKGKKALLKTGINQKQKFKGLILSSLFYQDLTFELFLKKCRSRWKEPYCRSQRVSSVDIKDEGFNKNK